MKRRDFLFLTHAGDGSVHLSCQQLYMHFRDLTRAESHGRGMPRPYKYEHCHELERVESDIAKASTDNVEWWAGEPESELARESPDTFFRRLGEALHGKRRLELADKEWLGDAELRQHVEQLLIAFQTAGGEVVSAPQSEITKQTP